MAKATLIQDNGNEGVYELANGEVITIKIDEGDLAITYLADGVQIGLDGEFEFWEPNPGSNRYLLGRMYVPIKRQGLGRATVQFFKEYVGATIFVRPHDGIKQDDGSHLTEDAPAFVTRMILEGLIEDNSNSR